MGVFRFWRDLGYAIGALLTGILADWVGIYPSILVVGGLTIFSALIIQFRMACQKKNTTSQPVGLIKQLV